MVATQLNHMKCHFISSTGQHTVWLECIWIAFNAALNINVGMLQLAEWQSTRCEVDILKLQWILHRVPIYYNVVQDFTRTLFLPLSFEWYSSECKHSCHWLLKNIQCNGKNMHFIMTSCTMGKSVENPNELVSCSEHLALCM